jgi:hypothetical protein
MFRSDRSFTQPGGGVCVLTKSHSMKATPVAVPAVIFLTSNCVLLTLSNDDNIRLSTCYRPPSPNTASDAIGLIDDLCNCLNCLCPANGTVIIICGDINFPTIDWSIDNSLNCVNTSSSGVFLEFYYYHDLQQLVTEATRGDKTLDIVFCND